LVNLNIVFVSLGRFGKAFDCEWALSGQRRGEESPTECAQAVGDWVGAQSTALSLNKECATA